MHFMLNQLIPTQQSDEQAQQLVQRIKNGGPVLEIYQRHDSLLEKSVQGKMTPAENEELQQLIPIIEVWASERMILLIELSKHWNVSVVEVMQRLDIKTPDTIYE